MLSVAAGEPQVHTMILPLFDAFGFVAAGVLLANYVFPAFHPFLMEQIPDYPKYSFQPRDELHLFAMIACLIFFGWIGSLIGSHLLGAFVAGICFVNVPRSHLIWKRQMKRIINWCMRIFFGASVAFSIPVTEMISVDAIWKGALVGLVPCIFTKILAGYMYCPTKNGRKSKMKRKTRARKRVSEDVCCSRLGNGLSYVISIDSMLVGFAMVGRGEFAYLVAQMSKSTDYLGGFKGQKMMNESVSL
jgi:Kef-type K+ transport system membrane component KefB